MLGHKNVQLYSRWQHCRLLQQSVALRLNYSMLGHLPAGRRAEGPASRGAAHASQPAAVVAINVNAANSNLQVTATRTVARAPPTQIRP